MVVALFITAHCTTASVSERAKRHNFSRTTKKEDALSRKKERTDVEAARRASLINEENRLMRARYLHDGASSSGLEAVERSTIEGAATVVGITKGVVTTVVAGSKKLDPYACLSLALCAICFIYLPPCFYIFYALGTIVWFFLGWGTLNVSVTEGRVAQVTILD